MRKFLFLFCLCFLSLGISAQEIWTLEAAVQHAIENSINVKMSEIDLADAKIQLNTAKHAKYPNLNANTGAQWNFGRTVDPTSNTFITETFFANNISLNTGMTIFNGGKIRNSLKQSEVLKKAAMADRDQQVRTISLTVATLFLNSIFALENKRINENQLVLSEEQLKQTQLLIDNGALPRNEALTIEAQIATDKQSIITSENTYQSSLLDLKQYLRLEPDVQIALEIPNMDNLETTDPFLVNFEDVYQYALETRPEILAGKHRLESSVIAHKISKADRLPSLTFGASLGTNYSNQGLFRTGIEDVFTEGPVIIDGEDATLGVYTQNPIFEKADYNTQIDENLSYGFGFGLNIPIYNNKSVNNNIERTELNVIRTRLNNNQINENLKISTQQTILDCRAAKLQLEASESALVAQKASFDNAEKKHSLGSINTFEYISAKNLLDNAEINALIAKYDYLFKLKILEFNMGKPLGL